MWRRLDYLAAERRSVVGSPLDHDYINAHGRTKRHSTGSCAPSTAGTPLRPFNSTIMQVHWGWLTVISFSRMPRLAPEGGSHMHFVRTFYSNDYARSFDGSIGLE